MCFTIIQFYKNMQQQDLLLLKTAFHETLEVSQGWQT